MLDFLAGAAVTITVPFARDGEPFVPSAGAASWTLRGQDGVVLTTGALTGIADTSAQVVIDAAQATITGGRIFEKRTLLVSAEHEGQPYRWAATYRIHAWLNLTADAGAVRSFIGCDESELPDGDIDLLGAYLKVVGKAGQAAVTTALASGTLLEAQANTAVTAQAVLDVLPGLAQRLAKRETDGNRNIERFELDVVSMDLKARTALKDALEAVAVVDDTTTVPTIFVVATRTDPVTGI